jgi:hypothetical protein
MPPRGAASPLGEPTKLGAQPVALAPRASAMAEPALHRGAAQASVTPQPAQTPARPEFDIQRVMARIQEASQIPPLSPKDYAILFEVAAQEIAQNSISGAQTVSAILAEAGRRGIGGLRRQDVQFVLDVIGEADPWFEQAATPALFAGRFRNFVVARCREFGLLLSMRELDLIDAWFVGSEEATLATPAMNPDTLPKARHPLEQKLPAEPTRAVRASGNTSAQPAAARQRWWANEDEAPIPAAAQGQAPATATGGDEDMPRFVRTRRS